MKYYYLYQITNLINGKIYIGIHRTNDLDDGYMGSGLALKRAQKKYGLENFSKEILEHFDSEDDMYQKEIELVDADFILREDTYNLTEGGCGGSFTAVSKGGKKAYKNELGIHSKFFKEKNYKYLVSEKSLIHLLEISNMVKNSDEIQNKIKETYKIIKHQQGKTNSQYGTMWITNDVNSKKIKKDDVIPKGWRKGKVQKSQCNTTWITDGINNTRIKKNEYIPIGWNPGKTQKIKNKE